MLQYLRARTPFLFGLAVILSGIFLGEYWNLYYRIAHFDKMLHVLGGIIAGWTAAAILGHSFKSFPWYIRITVIIAVTCLVGVLWEFAEYASNFTRHSYPVWYHYFHGGDLADTLGDLTADISGGALFAIFSLVFGYPRDLDRV